MKECIARIRRFLAPADRDTSAVRPDVLRRIIRNSIVNMSSPALSAVFGAVLVPLMFRELGASHFGIWIAGSTIVGMAGLVDLGLHWSVVRGIASEPEIRSGISSTAVAAYVLIWIAVAAAVVVAGVPVSLGMHLSHENAVVARSVFNVFAIALLGEYLNSMTVAIFSGIQRFDLANWATAALTLLRTGVSIVLLVNHATLLTLAVVHAILTILIPTSVLAMLPAICGIRVSPLLVDWSILRSRISFSFDSFIASVGSQLLWGGPPLLVGFWMGAPAVARLYAAQKLPFMISTITWRIAEVLFPLAGADRRVERRTVTIGTVWIIAVTLPACLFLYVFAAPILQIWLGVVDEPVLNALRITSGVVLIEALSAASVYVMWAGGNSAAVRNTLFGGGLAAMVLSTALAPALGIAGVAAAVLLAMIFITAVTLWLLGRQYRDDSTSILPALADSTIRMVGVPLASAAAAAALLRWVANPQSYVTLIAEAAIVEVVFCVAFAWVTRTHWSELAL